MPSDRRHRPINKTANGNSAARTCPAPCNAPTKIAGRITIDTQTLVPSANATTSANVRHFLSVTCSDTSLECTTRRSRTPAARICSAHVRHVGLRPLPPAPDPRIADVWIRLVMRLVVTIDGPAGAGKSTVAKVLARRLGYSLLDTGAIYRSVALVAMQRGIPWDDAARLAEVARDLAIEFKFVGD